MNDKIFLSTKEVASRYGLSVTTLEAWRRETREGKTRGPVWLELDGNIRYHINDLQAWEQDSLQDPDNMRK